MRVPDGSIHVDGRLDEAVWQQIPPIGPLVQKEPVEGAAPTERTDVRFAYDDDALYVGARMSSPPGLTIQAPMGRRDRGEQAENLLVVLDTFDDHRTAYAFGVTATGVRIDRYYPQDDESNYDEGFDPVWLARTRIDANGWTAELWIPFSQLRFNEREQQVWGLDVHRFIPTRNEDDYWVPIPRTVVAWSSRFGELRGIQRLKTTRRVEFLPYVAGASTINSNRNPANPFDTGLNLASRAGADLKMGVGPNLTLDATFHPDFGQVEADPAVVNLSAFETIYTEKRPFFTEGAQLLNLSTVNNFFYSRRIGAQPSGPASGDFVDYPQNTTIIGAGKLTGRLPSGTSIGVLGAVTAQEDAHTFNLATASSSSVTVAPRTTYGVARVQQEFGVNKSTVSGMVTLVHRDLASGDPLASLLVRNAFTVAGDSTLRFKGGRYQLTSYGGASLVAGDAAAIARVQRSSAHYAQRPDRTYDPYDPTRTSLPGYKAGTTMARTGGRHWIWSVTNDYESPGLEVNDMGRLNAADGIQLNGNLRYRETVPGRLLRGYWVGIVQSNEWNYGGGRPTKNGQIYASQTWTDFWTSSENVTRLMRTEDWHLTRGGPQMQTPNGWSTNLKLSGRPSGETSWNGSLTLATDEDGGFSRQFTGDLSLRPGPRWQLSLDPSLLREADTQQYMTTISGGSAATYGQRYVFGRVDRRTYSMQIRVGYTLKPDVNLDVYAEPFAASGRYSDIGELAAAGTRARRQYGTDGTAAVTAADGSLLVTDGASTFTVPDHDFNVLSFRSNVVLRWEYRPGSTLYVVWSENRYSSVTSAASIDLTDPFRSLTVPGTNYFVVKTSFWLPL